MAKGDWQRKLVDWLQGRQGPDDLAVFSVNLAIVIVLVNLFLHVSWLGIVALLLVAYSMFRIQSKNLGARARENEHRPFRVQHGSDLFWIEFAENFIHTPPCAPLPRNVPLFEILLYYHSIFPVKLQAFAARRLHLRQKKKRSFPPLFRSSFALPSRRLRQFPRRADHHRATFSSRTR